MGRVGILPLHQLQWFLANIYLDPRFEPLISHQISQGFIHSDTALVRLDIPFERNFAGVESPIHQNQVSSFLFFLTWKNENVHCHLELMYNGYI